MNELNNPAATFLRENGHASIVRPDLLCGHRPRDRHRSGRCGSVYGRR
ncbi:MAG: hypothetical protein JRE61_15985 [Deltaproteobacteria bacterium]|nr:hypothetical protein [Deltaproteobacteria bacterium]